MRPKLALKAALLPTGTTPQNLNARKALVLGDECASDTHLIARQLQSEGFQVQLPTSRLPAPSDPSGLTLIRGLLEVFSTSCRGNPSGQPPVLHPGTSAWALRPEVPFMAQELGLIVLSPSVRVLSLFSNRLNLLNEADRLGIEHLRLSYDPLLSVREVERLKDGLKLPFPFVLKSVRPSESFGFCVVQEPEDFERKLPLWIEQLRRSLGEAAVYVEKYVEGARHIVAPFARFQDGKNVKIRSFPFVDISLQSRQRRLIEFSHQPMGIESEAKSLIDSYVQKLSDAVSYVGVGHLEFLVDDRRVYLIDGSPGLGSSFSLWEKVAGTRAVSWQLATAQSALFAEPTTTPDPRWAYSLSLRLYAEDPLLQLPQPGRIRELSEQRNWTMASAAAELNLGVEQGQGVDPEGSGALGALLVGGSTQRHAVTAARGILDELWIAGSLQTNERFLGELLSHPFIREGMFHAGFIDEEFVPTIRPSAELSAVFATVCEVALGELAQGASSVRWAVGDLWAKSDPARFQWLEGPLRWNENGLPGVSGKIQLTTGRKLRVIAYPLFEGKWTVRLGEWTLSVRRVVPKLGPKAKPRGVLLSLVSGRVHALLYREGSVVPAHEPVLIVESLGVLVPHALASEVRIGRWKTGAEDKVTVGQELAECELPSRA